MARPKKKRDKDVKAIKKAVQSGEIQTDPIEDYYLDPYGRPIVQMLNEAPVETLGNEDRDLAADVLNVLGVAAREGVGLLPLAGEALDAGEVAYAEKYGTDYYGNEISPELLGGLTAAGYLVPNILERPARGLGRAIKKGYKKIKDKLAPKPGDVKVTTSSQFVDEAGNPISRQEFDRQASPESKILVYGKEMYGERVSDPMVSQTKENLMQFVNSDDYRDRVVNSIRPRLRQEYDDYVRFNELYPEDALPLPVVGEKEAQAYADNVVSGTLRNLRNSEQFIVEPTAFHKRNLKDHELKPDEPVPWAGLGYRSGTHDLATRPGPSIVLSENAKRSTAAHEFGHTSMSKGEIVDAAMYVDTPEMLPEAKKFLQGQPPLMGQPLDEYYADPDEIRARAFEVIDAARFIGVTTDDMVDAWMKAKRIEKQFPEAVNPSSLTPNQKKQVQYYYDMWDSVPKGLRSLLEYFDPDDVKNYLNKVYSLLPVAGVGAVAATKSGMRADRREEGTKVKKSN